jgi:hypothetical protein
MRKYLLVLLLMGATPPQVLAGVVGTQCWIDGKLVGGFPAGYTCPGTGGGRSSGGGVSSNLDSSTYNGFYQLGYQFGQWLVGSGSNPQADLQKQQMMAELQRRQAEAERQHQEEEARRLAAMYNRLTATLKLSGLPNLQLKEILNKNTGLKLKLGDGGNDQAGIKGLPGMYLNDDKKPYGIQGLPGIYTGGPGQESGLQNSELKLKLGDAATEPNESQPPSVTGGSAQALTTESGLQLKSGDSNAQPAVFDPSKMTPQQLADVAEQVSRLTPEDQQRILSVGQPTEGAIGQSSLQEQANASRAAAGAVVPEDASAKARAGFDHPIGTAPVQLGKAGTTPTIPAPPRTAASVNRPPLATSAATEQSTHAPPAEDWIKLYLFPGEPSPATRMFPKNPNPPLTNPLRDEKKLQAELKAWDDWAVQRSVHASASPEDKLYPSGTERKMLNTSTVKQFAPQLLDRYNSDIAFRQRVDSRLQQVNEKVAFDYYQELANAHKGALLDYQAELGKLAASGKLDARITLEDQYRLHPERRQLVQSVWSRIAASEQAALEQALANVGGELDKEYRIAFGRILKDDALQH